MKNKQGNCSKPFLKVFGICFGKKKTEQPCPNLQQNSNYASSSIDRLSALPVEVPHQLIESSTTNLQQNSNYASSSSSSSSVDRISALPDDIIYHILSFLPATEFSVQTSIFAKRWRYMWAHVPNLSFYSSSEHHKWTMGISNVVDSVLSQHKLQHIDSFYMNLFFTSNGICNKNKVGAWITTLIERNVRKLHLKIVRYNFLLELPTCLFTCKTLVDLSLESTRWQNRTILMPAWTDVVYLPALKKLRLDGVDYESDESLPHLLSGCPVLEELSIDSFTEHNYMSYCYISSPTLKRLDMNNLDLDTYKDKALKLDTPALTYLLLDEWRPQNIVVTPGALTSLTEADVAFRSKKTPLVYFRSILEFLCMLYDVKSLRLRTKGMEVPNSAFSDLTIKFHNLTKLKLNADWRFITKFLENADNLQELEITTSHDVNSDVLNCWMEPKKVPPCMVSRLHCVSIDEFGCTTEEEYFNMVRYILGNAMVLKRMFIGCLFHRVDVKEAHERISLFERGSEVLCTYLPALKKLCLRGVSYDSDESLPHLISGCPVLDGLSIYNLEDNIIYCYISSPTLKRFDIFDLDKVKLDTPAPALIYLRLYGCPPGNIVVTPGALTSLIKADVGFCSNKTPHVYFRSVLEFLCKLKNVKSLG